MAGGVHGRRRGRHEPRRGVPQRRRRPNAEADQPRGKLALFIFSPHENPWRCVSVPKVALLNRTNVYEAGHTLVHLAIRFHREDMLARLLSHFEADSLPATNGGRGVKYVPSYVAPDLASAIRRHVSQALRQRKGPFPCFYLAEWATYSLPPGELALLKSCRVP